MIVKCVWFIRPIGRVDIHRVVLTGAARAAVRTTATENAGRWQDASLWMSLNR
jgi:hypothetical protein